MCVIDVNELVRAQIVLARYRIMFRIKNHPFVYKSKNNSSVVLEPDQFRYLNLRDEKELFGCETFSIFL